MKIIVPITITETALQRTIVPEADYAAYSTATTYNDADTVTLTSGVHHNYESLQSPNLNHVPQTETAWWLDLGATNRWKAFDEYIETQTENPAQITYELAFGTADSLHLGNMDCDAVEITLCTPGSNLITNGEFCADTSGWAAYNSSVLTVEAGGAVGNYLKILGGSPAGWHGATWTLNGIDATATYRFRGLVSRIEAGTVTTYKVGIGTAAGETTLADLNGETQPGALAWNTPELSCSVIPGATAIVITIGYVRNNTAIDYLGYDRISFIKMTEIYNTAIALGAADPATQITKLSRTDLVGAANSVLSLDFTNPGTLAKVGMIKIGNYRDVGTTLREPEVGFIDYSEWTTNTQGSLVTAGATTDTMTITVSIANSLVDGALRVLRYYQSTPAVFVADGTYSALQIYGFIRSFSLVYKYLNHSVYRIKIDGKTT